MAELIVNCKVTFSIWFYIIKIIVFLRLKFMLIFFINKPIATIKLGSKSVLITVIELLNKQL